MEIHLLSGNSDSAGSPEGLRYDITSYDEQT